MAIRRIRFRRGNQADLPSLATGEPGLTLDTDRFYIGGEDGNIEVATKDYVDTEIADLNVDSTILRKKTVPTTSQGASGDALGDIAISSTHLYYCTANFTGSGANIWKRVAWSNDTW